MVYNHLHCIMNTDPELAWLVICLAIVAKSAGNITWFINFVQSMELFPTCARVSGIGLVSSVSLIITTSAPYLTNLVCKSKTSK